MQNQIINGCIMPPTQFIHVYQPKTHIYMPPPAPPAALHPPLPLTFTPYALWKSHLCIYATTSDNCTSHSHVLLQNHIYVRFWLVYMCELCGWNYASVYGLNFHWGPPTMLLVLLQPHRAFVQLKLWYFVTMAHNMYIIQMSGTRTRAQPISRTQTPPCYYGQYFDQLGHYFSIPESP